METLYLKFIIIQHDLTLICNISNTYLISLIFPNIKCYMYYK